MPDSTISFQYRSDSTSCALYKLQLPMFSLLCSFQNLYCKAETHDVISSAMLSVIPSAVGDQVNPKSNG